MHMPIQGRSREEIFGLLEGAAERDLDWRAGGTFAYTYHGGDDVEAVAKHAYMRFLTENALDPTVYPSLLKFENDIIAMARAHLGGDENVVGNFTSGGTESCMLAVKTARDYARATRPQITAPEVILPHTAHAAFHKACHYFGVNPVAVGVHPKTLAAEPAAIEAAITPNTIQIVAGAVSYAHGIMDPIPEIGVIAQKHKLLFHVDGCIGAFLLPYWQKLGRKFPPFDFSVPGVTSISMDFHKYGYCPKGASVLLYRSKDIRRHQIFACSQWTGYSIVNTTIQSSKSGGPVAACWAVIQYLGEDGYMRLAKRTLEATDIILSGLRTMQGIEILGEPALSLVAFRPRNGSPFVLLDEMRERGWYIQPQLSFGASPANVHITIRHDNLEGAPKFLNDLKSALTATEARGTVLPEEAIAQARALNPKDLTPELFGAMMRRSAGKGTAARNELINAMEPGVREFALREFLNELYTPTVGDR